jgi:hypothetical protein
VAAQALMVYYAIHGGDPGGPADSNSAGGGGVSGVASGHVGGDSVPIANMGVMNKSVSLGSAHFSVARTMTGF